MKTETPDRMTIKQWADNKKEELKEEIFFYIKEGMPKDKAIEVVLEETCNDLDDVLLGTGYKAQIRYGLR